MKSFWVAIAIVCTLVATVFIIQLKFEGAFVIAAVGAVAWFLNYRQQLRARLSERERENESLDHGRGVDEEHNAEDSVS
jgi:membrane protein implicated in regulation of membrane protease activity